MDSVGKPALDVNLYRYAANNPVNFVDPDGKNPVAIGAGIGLFIEPGLGTLIGAGIGFAVGIIIGYEITKPDKCENNDCDNKLKDCLENGWRLVAGKGGKILKERIECSKCYVRCKTEGGWPMDMACRY